MISFFLNKS